MVRKWQWVLRKASKRIWFRASLFSVLGVVTALVAFYLKQYIPDNLSNKVGAEAVDNILGIIASSMLAVTTFSLSTMVAAYSSATTNVTPRTTSLLLEDSTTQNALATFIGSFLFSLVGIIALSTGLYGDKGRVVLFVVTIAVIVLIVYTLLRWIDHLARLGRLGETTDRVEKAVTEALRERLERPFLGGRELVNPDHIPPDVTLIYSDKIGYIQHIDVAGISGFAAQHAAEVFLLVLPGTFVDKTRAVAYIKTPPDGKDALPDIRKNCLDAFSIDVRRSYEQDPRFGLCVLAEIASRALSPAINDPGTAIDIVGRGVRVLSLVAEFRDVSPKEPECPNVYVPALTASDMFDDFFGPIARDGAAMVEVGIRMQKALNSLMKMELDSFETAARKHAGLAYERAKVALQISYDKDRLKQHLWSEMSGEGRRS